MENKKKRDLAAIASIPLMMTLANSMLIPVLPAIQKVLGINSFKTSLIITSYAVIAIFFIPVAGYLSDLWGRKKVILPGLIIVAAAGALSGWASIAMEKPYTMIMIGRLFQGLGASACFPVVLPLVGDLFKSEDDVSTGLGIVETANTFGKVLSPILGSALAMWAWYIPFWSIPVFSLISIILISIWVKVPPDKNQKPISFGEFMRSIKDLFRMQGKWLWGVFSSGGLNMFVMFASLFYLSEMLEDRHIDGIAKGGLVAIPLAALCATSFGIGKWIGQNRALMKWISVIGFLIATACMAYLALTGKKSTASLLVFLFIGFAGLGAVLPSLDALITEGIKKEQRGTVTSFYSSIRFIGVAMGPPLAALINKFSALFWLLSISCLAASLVVLWSIKPKRAA
ncbi:major facilitator superfamily MFS_1 [Paenibacillus curdlanolyticus YK9]|uniref:Major facilitator superfamily MFS_1 n=1 Tax=Paenibacillus curdlanolyticus YK9 TaxID=717606 RepID=E0I3W5_9BACL|nr:MFS transporter [Paenibacillus curdlanolyticus]EFM12979.1 major facilitator superfamily MFS_1 [Paenibacillus curdlanolyticus YK9]